MNSNVAHEMQAAFAHQCRLRCGSAQRDYGNSILADWLGQRGDISLRLSCSA
jgi:hypothetical protein